jgi:hypothetical protein
MHKRYSAIALCAAAVALAGCGGSGNSGSGTVGLIGHHSPSTAVFRFDLATLCRTGNAAVKAVATDPTKALAVLGKYLTKFKNLTASVPLQPAYASFLSNLTAEAAALRAGNATALKSATQKNAALAKQLGVPACAG